MEIPHKSAYKKWIAKFQSETKPRSLNTFTKATSPIIFTRPEITTSSKTMVPTKSNVRKPAALTVDNDVYEANCSRRPTHPTLATSPKRIILPHHRMINGATEPPSSKKGPIYNYRQIKTLILFLLQIKPQTVYNCLFIHCTMLYNHNE